MLDLNQNIIYAGSVLTKIGLRKANYQCKMGNSMLSEYEYSIMKSALLKGIKELEGKAKHGNPSYYDLAKWIGAIDTLYYDKDEIDKIVEALHRMEKEGLIVGEGGYWIKGTHSGAGAKKWKLSGKPISHQERLIL